MLFSFQDFSCIQVQITRKGKALAISYWVTKQTKKRSEQPKHGITLELMGSEGHRFLSIALPSNILNKRTPSLLAKILIPLSLVVTASKDPSLLNLSLGLACKE